LPQQGSVRRVRSGPDNMSAASVQEAAGESRNEADSRFEPEHRGTERSGASKPPQWSLLTMGSKRESASPQGCPHKFGFAPPPRGAKPGNRVRPQGARFARGSNETPASTEARPLPLLRAFPNSCSGLHSTALTKREIAFAAEHQMIKHVNPE